MMEIRVIESDKAYIVYVYVFTEAVVTRYQRNNKNLKYQ